MNNILFEEIQKVTNHYKKGKFSLKSMDSFKIDDVSLFNAKNPELEISNSSKSWNSVLFLVFVLIVFLGFIGRSYKLQIIEGESNLVLAEGNRVKVVNVQGGRGLIRDRNGEILVRNKPAFSVEMNTEICSFSGTCDSELKSFLEKVELEVDLERVEEELVSGKSNIVVISGISKEETLTIEGTINEFPNLSIGISPEREYLFGEAFAHLIGYVGFGNTLYPTVEGKAGVEEKYNDSIKGISGGEIIQVDSSGRKVNILSEKKPISGRDIELYVDKGLQIKAYELLKEKVDGGDAKAGVIVAQDPRTGGILTLVSYPAYEPNAISKGLSVEEFKRLSESPNFPFFNRAISATYPPASTFKMIMAAATLMEGIVDEYYQITDNGFIQVGTFIFRNWRLDGHGQVDMRRALQVSNDTYFYTMGGGYGGVGGLGIERIAEWAKKFGFGELTGIDLSGEVAGFMPDGSHRNWYLGDTYIASIGQGEVLSTPLQLNNVTTYYGNGGFLFKPRVVKSVDGVEFDTEVISQNLTDSHTYDIVREGLNLAVKPGGTAYPLFDFPQKFNGIELGGKTGTAEFGGTDNEDTHAWFTVFGPYDDGTAEIALTVFLEEGGSGSGDAAPIARELLDYWFGMPNSDK